MTNWLYPPPDRPALQVAGSDQRLAVRRVYCVGQNYAAHAVEMGSDPDREPPFFFSKPGDAVVHGADHIHYPPRTQNLHHEVELVVAIGKPGRDIPLSEAMDHVGAYAVGVDLTRRDLQAQAKKKGRPWDTAKGFDASAPIAELSLAAGSRLDGSAEIRLQVNGELRQQSTLSQMIWSVPEIVAELSTYFTLQPGDLVFTGTPAGVAALEPGDEVLAEIDGLSPLAFTMAPMEQAA